MYIYIYSRSVFITWVPCSATLESLKLVVHKFMRTCILFLHLCSILFHNWIYIFHSTIYIYIIFLYQLYSYVYIYTIKYIHMLLVFGLCLLGCKHDPHTQSAKTPRPSPRKTRCQKHPVPAREKCAAKITPSQPAKSALAKAPLPSPRKSPTRALANQSLSLPAERMARSLER